MTATTSCMDHTYGPSGYVDWHEWAEHRAETHDQSRCDECGLWHIWTERSPRNGSSRETR